MAFKNIRIEVDQPLYERIQHEQTQQSLKQSKRLSLSNVVIGLLNKVFDNNPTSLINGVDDDQKRHPKTIKSDQYKKGSQNNKGSHQNKDKNHRRRKDNSLFIEDGFIKVKASLFYNMKRQEERLYEKEDELERLRYSLATKEEELVKWERDLTQRYTDVVITEKFANEKFEEAKNMLEGLREIKDEINNQSNMEILKPELKEINKNLIIINEQTKQNTFEKLFPYIISIVNVGGFATLIAKLFPGNKKELGDQIVDLIKKGNYNSAPELIEGVLGAVTKYEEKQKTTGSNAKKSTSKETPKA
jgi:hypothetical protein